MTGPKITHSPGVPDDAKRAMEIALRSPIPKIYANGFAISLTGTDANVVMTMNGQPIVMTTLSFSAAKTLGTSLLELVQGVEKVTGGPVLTIEEMQVGIAKLMGEQS